MSYDVARVAVVMADGFEDREFDRPRAALEAAGHDVSVIAICVNSVAIHEHRKRRDQALAA